MKVIRLVPLLAGAALLGGAAPARAAALVAPVAPVLAPTAGPRLQDPRADSLYRAAREALGRGDYRQAESLFRRFTSTYTKSSYFNDARYYEAFALYRAGGTADLRRARQVLGTLRGDTTREVANTLRRDALSLDTRICGELAQRGDEKCAREVRERADTTSFGAVVRGAVDVAMATARDAMNSPEVARAMGEAQAAAVDAAREGTRAAAEAMRSPEVQRAIAEAGQQAARASSDAARAVADGLRGTAATMEGVGEGLSMSMSMGSSRRRDPNCRDSDDDERVIALNALQQMDAERALPTLRKVMARRDACSETLRRRAVFLIGQRKSPEAGDLLVSVARTDPDADVREEAVHWLSRVGGDRAVDFLRDVARSDTSVALRKRAVFSLAQSREPRARETLRALASSRETTAEVRGEAIYWLGSRATDGDAEFVRRLFPSLESRELKERAIAALARQKDNASWLAEIARDGREPLEVRRSALAQVTRSATVPQLIAMWDGMKEKELKEPLILALARRKEPEALDKLIAIARSDADRDVRKSAVFWLSRSTDPKAFVFLQELIEK